MFGKRMALALTIVCTLLPLTALAGGWSVVTLDSTPSGLRAGTAFRVGFTVLQHGDKPMAGLKPLLHFKQAVAARSPGLAKGGGVLSFEARPEGETGHYVAEVTLPSDGAWDWEIEAFGAPAKMSALTVGAAAQAQTGAEQAKAAPATGAAAPEAQPAASAPRAGGWIVAGVLVAGVLALVALLAARRPRRSTAGV